MRVFHGTTRENAERILSGKAKDNYTWTVSDDDYLYVWNPVSHIKQGECDTIHEAFEMCTQKAFESAQITAAMSDAPQSELVVLVLNVKPKDLDVDYSCKNMELASIINDIDYNYKEAHMYTLKAKHNSRLDAFVISGLLENPHFPSYKLDDDLIEAAKLLQDRFLEELLEFDWERE